MRRKCYNGLFYSVTACCLFSITTIFSSKRLFVLQHIEIAIRPSAVRSFFDHEHFFGWYFRILLLVKIFRKHIQLITAMLNNKQLIYLVVPIQAHHVAKPGGITYTITIGLIQFIRSELPDTT